MKYLLLFLLPLSMSAHPLTIIDTIPDGFFPLGLSIVSYGESELSLPWDDCGTWKALPEKLTRWIAIDTVSMVIDTARNWVHDQEELMVSNMVTLEYAPCGKGTPTRYRQQRICAINGIIQERFRIIRYKYIPKPKSEFEKVIESFKK